MNRTHFIDVKVTDFVGLIERRVWQYDSGLVLRITGFDSPDGVTIEYTREGRPVPFRDTPALSGSFLLSPVPEFFCDTPGDAWIYIVHRDEESELTAAAIRLIIIPRPKLPEGGV